MDGIPCSWNAASVQESFGHSRPAADTLSRLAKLMARADQKEDGGRGHRSHPAHPACGCPECRQAFTDTIELLHHQEAKQRTLPKPHQCLSCGSGFSLLSSLQLHTCLLDASPPCEICRGETPSGAAPCPACSSSGGASAPDGPGDESARLRGGDDDGSPYACALCGRGFSQKQALRCHQQAGCSEPPSPLNGDDTTAGPPPDSPPAFTAHCPFCDKIFHSGAGIVCHKRLVHPQEYLLDRIARGLGKGKVNGGKRGKPDGRGRPKLIRPQDSEYPLARTAQIAGGGGLGERQVNGGKRGTFGKSGKPDGRGRPPGKRGRPKLIRPQDSEYPLARTAQVAGGGGGLGERQVNGGELEGPKSKLLTCRSCDMVFQSTAKLHLHRREKHRREKDPGRDHPRPASREKDPGRDHPRPAAADDKRRKGETYPCLVCGKVFLHHLSLYSHSKQHAASPLPPAADQKQKLGQSAGGTDAKDSKLAGKQPKKLKHNVSDDKAAGAEVEVEAEAGPGTEPGLGEGFNRPGRPRKVPTRVEEDVDREFPCPSCPQVFSLQAELLEHVELHQSSVTRRNCSVCSQEMDTHGRPPGSKRHRLYHCVPCQRAFAALEPFLEHCQGHLRIRVEEDSVTENQR